MGQSRETSNVSTLSVERLSWLFIYWIKQEFYRKFGPKLYTIFTTPGTVWNGVKMCGKDKIVRRCYDSRDICRTLPERKDDVVLLLFL